MYDKFRQAQKWFHRTTEFEDFVDAVGGTLDDYPDDKPLHEKAVWLFNNADRIDINAAKDAMNANDIEDRVVGWFTGNAPPGASMPGSGIGPIHW